MAFSNSEPTLRDLAEKLDHLASDIDLLKKWQERTTEELGQSQKWQDRTWDVVKWVGGISAGLAISASIALFGIVLRQLASG